MKPLILDFVRRWRWLFIITLLVTIVSTVGGTPFVIAPAVVVALLIDGHRGVFRAVRPLPVTRLAQARAWWFVSVPLLPLLSLPALALGVLLFKEFNPTGNVRFSHSTAMFPSDAPPPTMVQREEMTGASMPPGVEHKKVDRFIAAAVQNGNAPAPWFAAGVQMWIAFGYAGFCFFLLQWAPTRAPETVAEHVQQGLFGLLWGISLPGLAFLLPNLPRTPAAIAPWHWALFAAAPVFVALSYFSSAELVRRRLILTVVRLRPTAAAEPGASSHGLGGIPLYVVTFAGRIVLFVALIACVQLAVFRWMIGMESSAQNPALGMQVSLMGMAIGAVIAESIGMRALRALPLSTPKLALLLAFIPWSGAVTSAWISAVWCRVGSHSLSVFGNFAAQTIAMCGWVTLAFAITLHIASSARFFVLMLLVMIPGATLQFVQEYTLPIAAVGAVAGLAGFALLARGLRKSSAFYRPRGFFGMTPGQPSAVR